MLYDMIKNPIWYECDKQMASIKFLLLKNVERIANKSGFRINEEKIRVRYRNQRQEVTGVVVNEKMQMSRKIRHKIRSDGCNVGNIMNESRGIRCGFTK